MHYPEFRKLNVDWQWHIVEGTAAAENCTSWCANEKPGLSTDGSSDVIDSLLFDNRVIVHRSEMWHGKIAMVNAPLQWLFEPCVLVEIDVDEMWTAEKLTRLHALFSEDPSVGSAWFYCRYFIGPNIAIRERECFGNHTSYEWQRAWRFEPGMRFESHEPPRLNAKGRVAMHAETEGKGLVFDHMAWANEKQVADKCSYYGSTHNKAGHLYATALDGWRRLQRNTHWPVKCREYMPFINDDSTVAPV